MRVPVAVYRWFEQGGAWAYDPLCATQFSVPPADALDETFDRWLKNPVPGNHVECDGKGQWLFWIERDPENLDSRTQPSETFLLRAILVPRLPAEEKRGRIEKLLRERTPTRAGEDPSLSFDIARELLPSRPGCLTFVLYLLGLRTKSRA